MTEVLEAYRDYTPPPGTRESVEALLETVPPTPIAGLANVVLTNSAALTGKRKTAHLSPSMQSAKPSPTTGPGAYSLITPVLDTRSRGA
jgi:hypothetical protein